MRTRRFPAIPFLITLALAALGHSIPAHGGTENRADEPPEAWRLLRGPGRAELLDRILSDLDRLSEHESAFSPRSARSREERTDELSIGPWPYRESGRPRVWTIRPDGTGDAPTIQAGVDSAAPGDTVLLEPGIFHGEGNRDIRFRGKALVVRGRDAPELHVIDCKGTQEDPHRGFVLDQGEGPGSVLSTLTVTGGHSTDHGGGILCRNGSFPTLENLIVRENRADAWGGGMFCYDASAEIVGCVFRGNTSRWGGGIYGRRAFLEVRDALFAENVAGHQDFDWGGAIGCDSSDYLKLERVRFESNRAPVGGAVSAYDTPLLAVDCAFIGNEADLLCGALYSFPIAPGDPVVLRNCDFSENTAILAAGAASSLGGCDTIAECSFTGNEANWAGAVFLGGDTHVRACSFTNNRARRSGGAFSIYGRAFLDTCTMAGNTAADSGGVVQTEYADPIRFERCTIAFNGAPHGGAVSVPSGVSSSVILSRSIVAFSDSGEAVLCDGTGGTAVLSCCDLYGNEGGDWVGFIAPQAEISGNFSADPLFCGGETNDFTLDAESPCLDAAGCGLVGAWGLGCGGSVGVAAEDGAPASSTFLAPNAPNPLNPFTTIRFGLKEPGAVLLALHDPAGRRVRILCNGERRDAGEHSVTWDGRDATGRAVASGVYLVRMETQGFSAARKILILR
ncbi:MAG: hypothetical protein FJY73_04815 [Candidatus Eisenbacteria bacterium]|nr:hypothetical protein [Candidatus Eisenbacteria bacterium]